MSESTVAVGSGNPLEQFVLLAKNVKGAAAVELVKQALEVLVYKLVLAGYPALTLTDIRPN